MPVANESRARAPHLPPEERRAALIAATRDAALRHEAVPTTKQISEQAGVAEGTIFRVFESKEELLDAVLRDCFDTSDLLGDIDAIDPALPLRERLYRLATIIQDRFQQIFGIMAAFGIVAPPHLQDADSRRRAAEDGPALLERLSGVIGDDADQLSVTPMEALQLLRLLTFSGSHPHISQGAVLTPQRIVDVLLDGISAHPTASAGRTSP